MCKNKEKTTSEKVKTYKGPSYALMIVLFFAVAVLAFVAILQCVQIKNYYSVRQDELTQIKESLVSFEEYVDEHPPTDENPADVQIEIAYPSTIDDLDEISDVLSIVQEDNAQALSTINSYLVIFSITITVVTIFIPILNYVFIQKDQIKRLNKQYKKSKEELKDVKEASEQAVARLNEQYEEYSRKSHEELQDLRNAYEAEVERMKKSIKQNEDTLVSLTSIQTEGNKGQTVSKITPISKSPEDEAFAHFINARLLYNREQYDKALQEIDEAIKLKDHNARFFDMRSSILNQMKRYDEALRDSNKAIDLEPRNAEYYYSRSATLHELKRYFEALTYTNRAIVLEPNNAKYYNNRGAMLLALKYPEEALKATNKAIELEPDNAEYYYSKACVLRLLKRFREAQKTLQKAIDIDPTNMKYYGYLAYNLYLGNQYKDALDCIAKMDKPDNSGFALKARAMATLKIALQERGEVTPEECKQILDDLEQAIKLVPDNQFSHIEKAEALLLLNDPDAAYQALQEALKRDPDEPDTYHWLAEYYRAIGEDENAKKYDKLAKEKGYIPEPGDEK